MLFTDVSSGRAVNVFKKAGFWALRESKTISAPSMGEALRVYGKRKK